MQGFRARGIPFLLGATISVALLLIISPASQAKSKWQQLNNPDTTGEVSTEGTALTTGETGCMFCVDTDGGNDPDKKGYIVWLSKCDLEAKLDAGIDPAQNVLDWHRELTDYCAFDDPNALVEYVCTDNDSYETQRVTCSNGCQDGACKPIINFQMTPRTLTP